MNIYYVVATVTDTNNISNSFNLSHVAHESRRVDREMILDWIAMFQEKVVKLMGSEPHAVCVTFFHEIN